MSGTKKIDISDHQMSVSISETGRNISVILLDKVIHHSVDLLKIDVDGDEESVLRGSTNVIKRDKPKIVMEYNEPRWQQSFEEIRSEHLSQYTDMKFVTKDQEIIDEESMEITVDEEITDIILS